MSKTINVRHFPHEEKRFHSGVVLNHMGQLLPLQRSLLTVKSRLIMVSQSVRIHYCNTSRAIIYSPSRCPLYPSPTSLAFQTDKNLFMPCIHNSCEISSHRTLKKDEGHQSTLMCSHQSMFLTYSTSRCDFSSQQRDWPGATGV